MVLGRSGIGLGLPLGARGVLGVDLLGNETGIGELSLLLGPVFVLPGPAGGLVSFLLLGPVFVLVGPAEELV